MAIFTSKTTKNFQQIMTIPMFQRLPVPTNRSFRTAIALTVLLVAMWTDDYQYQPIEPLRKRNRLSAYFMRIVSYEIIVGSIIWTLFNQEEADVYNTLTIFEMILGFNWNYFIYILYRQYK
ncbi:hypothetical protein GCK72_003077 [Caenorhabditis remanei]|uniref:Uncharacterized protein n=1 Tax=Caenorhabditis remanei TaxID=31234 RepID=A0A6A5HVN9_CAERE|nr:hypothetical protein GCK72_003077 [Caenorhabditis remanei]KAF1771251.1 hypothetical protein GCK72_003077 [Caenorhabditis remanei]